MHHTRSHLVHYKDCATQLTRHYLDYTMVHKSNNEAFQTFIPEYRTRYIVKTIQLIKVTTAAGSPWPKAIRNIPVGIIRRAITYLHSVPKIDRMLLSHKRGHAYFRVIKTIVINHITGIVIYPKISTPAKENAEQKSEIGMIDFA